MKKLILCILLISILFCLVSCAKQTPISENLSKLEQERHAIIFMPDGQVLEGMCTNMLRYSDNWIYVKINGIDYYLDTWRIVIWE